MAAPSGAAAGGGGDGASGSTVEEDASDLVFPKEFNDNDTKTLLISEVSELLQYLQLFDFSKIFAFISSGAYPPGAQEAAERVG